MARVQVTPDPFTLVEFDADRIVALAEEAAASVGLPDGVDVEIEVDEALPLPLTGSFADVVDGRAVLWFSGGAFEHPHRNRRLDEAAAGEYLARDLLRVTDRLGADFSDAPRDGDLTDQQRAAWDVWADGRLARLGCPIRESLRRYKFRLAHGFSDVVDAVYDRLWLSESLTWAELEAACAETAAVDTRSKPKSRTGKDRGSLRVPS